ncbi:hypothetical protein CGRA01v4_14593 [Colletotrichum graminicola]|nr:hypothetical protein CGRA01v4_14593 [Colletotrichum graminicola]
MPPRHSILVLVVARIPKSSPCVVFRAFEPRLQDPSTARSLSDGMACLHSSSRGYSQDSVATEQGLVASLWIVVSHSRQRL